MIRLGQQCCPGMQAAQQRMCGNAQDSLRDYSPAAGRPHLQLVKELVCLQRQQRDVSDVVVAGLSHRCSTDGNLKDRHQVDRRTSGNKWYVSTKITCEYGRRISAHSRSSTGRMTIIIHMPSRTPMLHTIRPPRAVFRLPSISAAPNGAAGAGSPHHLRRTSSMMRQPLCSRF